MNRRQRIQAAIARGDAKELLGILSGTCACVGCQDGEPMCPCKMNFKEIHEAVSLAGLQRGKVVRLKVSV